MTDKPNTEKPPVSEARQRLEEWLASPAPYLSAEEIVRRKAEKIRQEKEEELQLARERNRKVLQLSPYGGPQGRKWKPFVDKVSACNEYEPTALDRVREAVSRAAIGYRTMEDVVQRQEERIEPIADVVRQQDGR
jgi:hypothetical protein